MRLNNLNVTGLTDEHVIAAKKCMNRIYLIIKKKEVFGFPQIFYHPKNLVVKT